MSKTNITELEEFLHEKCMESPALLAVVIGEYIKSLNKSQITQLEDFLVNNFGDKWIMKYEVKFYVGGKIIKEEVYANSPKDARETGQARNPTAKIIGVNGTFR